MQMIVSAVTPTTKWLLVSTIWYYVRQLFGFLSERGHNVRIPDLAALVHPGLPLENITARTSCVLGTRLGVTVIELIRPRQRGRKVTEMDVGRRGYGSRQQN